VTRERTLTSDNIATCVLPATSIISQQRRAGNEHFLQLSTV